MVWLRLLKNNFSFVGALRDACDQDSYAAPPRPFQFFATDRTILNRGAHAADRACSHSRATRSRGAQSRGPSRLRAWPHAAMKVDRLRQYARVLLLGSGVSLLATGCGTTLRPLSPEKTAKLLSPRQALFVWESCSRS